MPPEIRELFAFLTQKALKYWSSPATLTTVAGISAAFLVTLIVHRRWKTNELVTDATHSFFYVSGLFTFIIAGPIYSIANTAITRWAPFLQLDLGRELHPIAHFVVLTLALDLVAYWAHRACHSIPLLWELHKVHHSQTMLTPLTNFRFHAGDVLLRTVLMLIPLAVFGTQTEIFLAVVFFEVALNGMAHSDLPWTYGIFGRLFVNPQFHRLHHSTDPRHFGRNFSQQYTFWDYLFGTAYAGEHEVPTAYGVPGEAMPRSFVGQQVMPVLTVLRRVLRAITPRRIGATRPADA